MINYYQGRYIYLSAMGPFYQSKFTNVKLSFDVCTWFRSNWKCVL